MFLGVSEAGLAALSQSQVLPDNLVNLFVQLPLVAVIIWLQFQNQKWLEHMLEVQRKSIKEIYAGQEAFLTALLNQIEGKQDKMGDRIELLAHQVAMFRETLSEAVNVKDVVDQLMEKINK